MLAKLKIYSKRFLFVVSVFWFLFALASGAEKFGEGIKGIIMNSPNAIPWAILLLIAWFTNRYERAGGVLIMILGVWTIFFFKTYEEFLNFITISFPLIAIGVILVMPSGKPIT